MVPVLCRPGRHEFDGDLRMVTMSILARKRFLLAVNIVLAAAIVACVCLCLLLQPGAEDVKPLPKDEVISAGNETGGRVGPHDLYAVIYERDIRKPLFDLKPIEPVNVEPPKPELAVRLIGTAVEPGFTYGLFRTESGESKLVSVGQKIGGAEVTTVGEGTATVKFHGELITLKVEPKGANR